MITLDETIAQEKEEAKRLRKIIETGYDGEISIEALFCDDTDAIKEVYERFENCAKEHEQLAELLEELKALRNGLKIKCDSLNEALEKGKKIGYNKAIDECLSVLYKNAGKIISIRFYEQIFDEMKQLKAGGVNEFELISQDSRFVTYRKGDRYNNLCVEFDLELKNVHITESMFIRNDTPMLEPQSEWIAHSAKYGYTKQMCPTLGMEDLYFINKKAKELFE